MPSSPPRSVTCISPRPAWPRRRRARGTARRPRRPKRSPERRSCRSRRVRQWARHAPATSDTVPTTPAPRRHDRQLGLRRTLAARGGRRVGSAPSRSSTGIRRERRGCVVTARRGDEHQEHDPGTVHLDDARRAPRRAKRGVRLLREYRRAHDVRELRFRRRRAPQRPPDVRHAGRLGHRRLRGDHARNRAMVLRLLHDVPARASGFAGPDPRLTQGIGRQPRPVRHRHAGPRTLNA